MLLVTFGNPLTGTNVTCVWNSTAFQMAGLGAREIQALCEKLGIEWRVVRYEY